MILKRLTAHLLLFLVVIISACEETDSPEVTEEPTAITVTISNPADGATLEIGTSFTVEGTTETAVDITNFSLWIDGSEYKIDQEAPYTFEVSDLPLGTHTLMIKAKDNGGVNHDSKTITITIVDTDKVGSLSIASLSEGFSFNACSDILITPTASDEDGIKEIELWIDNQFYETNNIAPYEFTINHLTLGSHAISLVMKDNKDNSTSSQTVNIEIQKESKDIVWDDFTLNLLEYERVNQYQNIQFEGSVPCTTEFLILSASHGDPEPGTRLFEAQVQGGGWTKIGYGGDDDKSAEIWFRQVTTDNQNNLGQIHSKNAAADLAILSYNGLIGAGTIQERYFFKEKLDIDHGGIAGPFLIIAATDNGRESSVSNLNYGYRPNGSASDDMTMLYLTDEDQFYDNTYKVKGGVVSIQLVN